MFWKHIVVHIRFCISVHIVCIFMLIMMFFFAYMCIQSIFCLHILVYLGLFKPNYTYIAYVQLAHYAYYLCIFEVDISCIFGVAYSCIFLCTNVTIVICI